MSVGRYRPESNTRALQWLLVSSAPDPPHPPEAFPPHDLMMELVDHYFRRYNIYLPLLHRPTFERNIKDGLHLRDEAFGSTLLLVCAMGSRFSTDERVLLEEEIITNATLDECGMEVVPSCANDTKSCGAHNA